MFRQKMSFWALTRLAVALLGYIGYKLAKDSRRERQDATNR